MSMILIMFNLTNLCCQCQIEKRDPRGRTPLHLAVTLGHIECVRVLLCHGADVFAENNGCWTGCGHFTILLFLFCLYFPSMCCIGFVIDLYFFLLDNSVRCIVCDIATFSVSLSYVLLK